MKYILIFLFISSAAICQAQSQQIKDLLPKGGDINASQYTKAQEARMRESITLESGNENILFYLNGKPSLIKGPAPILNLVEPQKITCIDIVTDAKKIADYTKDTSIKKLIIIETKE